VLDAGVLDLFAEAERDPDVDTSRALIIVPTIAEAEAVKDALAAGGHLVSTLTRKNRIPAHAGHLVATNIVDTGLTIIPPPSVLIDSGETVTRHMGRVQRLPTSPSTAEQRAGRVGRLRSAAIFTTPKSGTGPEPLPIAPHSRIATLQDATHARFMRAYGCEMAVAPVVEHGLVPSALDPYMALTPGHPTDVARGLEALWWLRCENGSARHAGDAYDLIELSGWTDHTEGLRNLLLRYTGDAWLPPRRTLTRALAGEPFLTVVAGTIRPATYVAYSHGAYRAA